MVKVGGSVYFSIIYMLRWLTIRSHFPSKLVSRAESKKYSDDDFLYARLGRCNKGGNRFSADASDKKITDELRNIAYNIR